MYIPARFALLIQGLAIRYYGLHRISIRTNNLVKSAKRLRHEMDGEKLTALAATNTDGAKHYIIYIGGGQSQRLETYVVVTNVFYEASDAEKP